MSTRQTRQKSVKMVSTGRPSPGCHNCRSVYQMKDGGKTSRYENSGRSARPRNPQHSTALSATLHRSSSLVLLHQRVVSLPLRRQVKKGCDQRRPACGRCVRLALSCYGYRDGLTMTTCNPENPGSIRATFQHLNAKVSDFSGIAAFTQHFRSPGYWLYEHFIGHALVTTLMKACSFALLATRDSNSLYRDEAVNLYGEALTSVRTALSDPHRATEDATLVAIVLLCLFEVISAILHARTCV